MKLRRRSKPVEIELTNGLGWPVEQIALVPGETVRLKVVVTLNVCDRGLPSEDGVHRLTTRQIAIPVRIRLIGGDAA